MADSGWFRAISYQPSAIRRFPSAKTPILRVADAADQLVYRHLPVPVGIECRALVERKESEADVHAAYQLVDRDQPVEVAVSDAADRHRRGGPGGRRLRRSDRGGRW